MFSFNILTISVYAMFLAYAYFSFARMRYLMLFFQQEEYDDNRFMKMVSSGKLIDRKATAACVVVYLLGLIWFEIGVGTLFCASFLFAAVLLAFALAEPNPIKVGKKKLGFTSRVKRIIAVAEFVSLFVFISIVYSALSSTASDYATHIWISLAVVACVQLQPIFMVASNMTLDPYEKKNQKRFYLEAKTKLNQVNPKIIAITGSYGKTSTKQVLAHILSSVTPTLATPGSVNTLMGISRIIREKLLPEHKFFIVEMGAYGPGSIERLCALTPPDVGAITAVGMAHYERFKSVDTVAKAKFELAQAVFAKGGNVVVNADAVDAKYIEENAGDNLDKVAIVSANAKKSGYKVKKIKQTSDGVSFVLSKDGEDIDISAPLFGIHQCHNIAVAFALAEELGVPRSTIVAALKSTPQSAHRLDVTKIVGAPTIIDDAYNSNPVGFASALEVMKLLGNKKSRRILVTPGMVELGAQHDEQHAKIGELAASIADVVLAIIPERLDSFIKAYETNKSKDAELHKFADFSSAKEWLNQNAKADDVILYENDLPDLYEAKINL